MSKRSEAIYQRGSFWLGWEQDGGGQRRPHPAIFWYDRDKQRIRRASTGTADVNRAIAALDAKYLAQAGQAAHFCPTCGRAQAMASKYLLLDAIGDYRLEVGDGRTSASAISGRLNHLINYLEEQCLLDTNCEQAATEAFARNFRNWSAKQPVVWRDKKGDVTVSKVRTPAATEESLHQLRAVLNHAVANDRSDATPKYKSLSRKRVSSPVTTRCDMSAIADMLAYASANTRRAGLHAFLIGSICTLARPDAVLDINTKPDRRQWSPGAKLIDLNPRGRIQTKKHRPVLPVLPLLDDWLRHVHAHPELDGWFVTYLGRPVKGIRSAWRTMLDDLQLPRQADWMPYILRRSLATELRGRRVDPWDLAGFMGHRVVGTTEIYTGGGLYSTVTSALSEILSEIEAKAPGALLPGSLGKRTLLPGSPTGLAG